MRRRNRSIGLIGTSVRVIIGAASLIVGVLIDTFALYSAALGVVVFPGVLLLTQWLRARVRPSAAAATGQAGFWLSTAVAVLLFVVPETRSAAFLFYGVSLLLAGARGYAGCEVLAIPNWLLRREDQVGCIVLSPIDAAERRLRDRVSRA